MVSAADTDFDDGSLDAQVRDQIAISKTLGAASTIVTVTHMDDVAWSQDRFSAISQAIVSCAKDVGSDPGEITIIPITAVGDNPDNLFEKSSASSWYEGVTLLDAMDALQAPPDLSTGSLRCSVEGVFRIKGVGDVLTGKVIRGTMVPNCMSIQSL